MSAHRLMDNNGLWTSATLKTIFLAALLPRVMRRHLLSPKLGMLSPFATSYSAPCEVADCIIEIPVQRSAGMTVSQAPLSTVTSISIQSSGDWTMLMAFVFLGINVLILLEPLSDPRIGKL